MAAGYPCRMLRDQKILITGPAGQIAFPLAQYLACDNDVWVSRASASRAPRERVEQAGVTTRGSLISRPVNSAISPTTSPTCCTSPRSWAPRPTTTPPSRQCRRLGHGPASLPKARGRHGDDHRFDLTNRTKIRTTVSPRPILWATGAAVRADVLDLEDRGRGGVVRTVSRMVDLPTVIAPHERRLRDERRACSRSTSTRLVAGQPITPALGPEPLQPIHEVDIASSRGATRRAHRFRRPSSTGAATSRSPAKNGLRLLRRAHRQGAAGRRPTPCRARNAASCSHVSKRRAITGPCSVSWRDGMRAMFEHRYPNGVDAGPVNARTAHAIPVVARCRWVGPSGPSERELRPLLVSRRVPRSPSPVREASAMLASAELRGLPEVRTSRTHPLAGTDAAPSCQTL